MEKTIPAMSSQEFQALIENAIDRRMEVWLTQLLDALGTVEKESEDELNPEFVTALQRSIEQAQAGETTSLKQFREKL